MNKSKLIRPMKASEVNCDRVDKLKFPLWVSPKLDGIRAIVLGGQVLSNTLKPFPSKFVQQTWGRPEFEGFDGELICGPPNDRNVYQRTFSAVMTHGSVEPVDFYVFDLWNEAGANYERRFERMNNILVETGVENNRIVVVEQHIASTWPTVENLEQSFLRNGYEGIMLRQPQTEYKFGRSTFLEQALLKLKRFTDSEATIIGAEELFHNNNEAVIDARGLTTRSTHRANKQASGLLGAIIVRDVNDGREFRVGTGFDAQDRERLWHLHLKGQLEGLIIKYSYFNYGVVDLPRHPKFKGFRSPIDM